MRKFLCSMVLAAFTLGIGAAAIVTSAGPSWADDEGAASESSEKPKKKKKPMGDKPKSVTGKIKAMDANSVTVVKKKKGVETEYVVSVTSKTKFKEVTALTDLKAGDRIGVKYFEKDGKMVAKSIEKKIPGKGKKKAHAHKKKKEGEEEKAEE